MENTVIKVLTKEHGKKVIEWWEKQGIDTRDLIGISCESDWDTCIYYGVIQGKFDNWGINTVQHYNAKIIELPTEEEFDMSTPEGILAYAKKHYPIGTEYKPLTSRGTYFCKALNIEFEPRFSNVYGDIKGNGDGLIYSNGKWAEIVKEEEKMETQKLSRAGLKEIHSVACGGWKEILEKYGTTNPLEYYIELTQEQVDTMFNSCTKEQLPIVSKYLKQDDGSVDLTTLHLRDNHLISIRQSGEHKNKAFGLNTDYDWVLNFDNEGGLCLIPTKKK